MDFLNHNLLTVLLFLPLIGAALVLAARGERAVRWTAFGAAAATFALSLILLAAFDWHAGHGYAYIEDGGVVQMVGHAAWIPALNIEYRVGIDGLSLPLVLLTTFISVLACVASWNVPKMSRGYFALLLLLESGILGVFVSLDLFLFYVFFEVSLLPMYFLIGIWGGPRKEYAAIKFFLYTLVGSIALLIALIGVYLYSRTALGPDHLPLFPATAEHGAGTFDMVRLAGADYQRALAATISGGASGALARALFVLLMVGFFVKVPAAPLHTWLPDAHVEAPTPISMILAALLLKMGGYGIFRVAYPLFPEAAKALWLPVATIGVVSIIYGALCAMAQTDFKKLVAYSSVSHMGYVTLGAAVMTAAATNGALFMMIAHGITSAMMFFVVGVIYDRAHHRELSRLGGIATSMPIYTGFSTVACFANLGLPGLCGFVGEVMVLLGAFGASRPDGILYQHFAAQGQLGGFLWAVRAISVVASFGMILTAGYMLWTIQRVFLGPEKPEYKGFPEVTGREIAVLTPLAVMAILLGVLPTVFFFAITNSTVAAMFQLLSVVKMP